MIIFIVITETVKNLAEIDKIIKDHLKGWKFDRIANVDLAILRLAISEILYMKEIPYNVSINEAIELAKYTVQIKHRHLLMVF